MAHDFRFGLFGHPVAHSLSPVMHAASFRSLGIDAEYLCFDVSPEALAARLDACRDGGLNGLNLTVPHKAAAVALMDRLDRSAHLFGAVNTVRIDAGKLTGFNTDAEGFLEDLAVNCRVTPEDRRVLILGCGGAGRALAIACASRGASEVMLANRTVAKAEQVAEEIRRLLPDVPVTVSVLPYDLSAWSACCREAELVVQCTTAGLRQEDISVLPPSAFRQGQMLYDIVYTQRVTPTMRAALEAGADAVNGAGMLVYQGAAAFALWTGLDADTVAMRAALEHHIYGGHD